MGAIKKSLPLVDPYTELGKKRSEPEMELEYQRILSRDTNPFSFLYKGRSQVPSLILIRSLTYPLRLPPSLGDVQIRLPLGKAFRPSHRGNHLIG
jgi:hypothetical protein